jgi:hypothetical protein
MEGRQHAGAGRLEPHLHVARCRRFHMPQAEEHRPRGVHDDPGRA